MQEELSAVTHGIVTDLPAATFGHYLTRQPGVSDATWAEKFF
jgi:hypothetical protein